MKTVKRQDAIMLDKASFTQEGFLRDCPIVTRTGIFEYINADGSLRREFRPHDEVCRDDSLMTYEGKPITLKHPSELVTADNAKQYTVGTILSVGKPDGENVKADIIIYDKDTIDSGKRELSLGYTVDLDMTPGETDGMKYDCIQRNIRINHLAVVDSARAGPVARLNLDGDQINYDKEDAKTMKVRLDNGCEYEAPQEVIAAIEQYRKDNGDLLGKVNVAEKQVTDLKKRLDTTEAERDTLKAEVAKFDEKLKTKDKEHADSINDAVKQRVSLLSIATAHNIEKADEMTERQIKEAVVKAVRGDDMDLTQKSDEYVNAAFDLCKDDAKNREDSMSKQRETVNGGVNNDKTNKDEVDNSVTARQRMIERTKSAYQGGKQ